MEDQNKLEVNGSIAANPPAEIAAEIRQAGLDGSLRIANGSQKTIIYFSGGEIVFAVSNARGFRLFSILLEKKAVDKAVLAKCPEFADDRRLAAELQNIGKFTKEQIDEFTVAQIEAIMTDALSWTDGTWTFSPLARLREDMKYKVGVTEMLRQYARCLPGSFVFGRFRSMDETFVRTTGKNPANGLMQHEKALLETIGENDLSLRQIIDKCGLPENTAIRSLYDLWIGGDVLRMNWNAAIPSQKLLAIRDAKVSKVRSAAVNSAYVAAPEPKPPVDEPKPEIAEELTVEEYLERIDKALTHYETLGVDLKTDAAKIKQTYFRLAKQFHPDRFHRSEPELAARVQKAFSNIAQAYETLKNPSLRENYDFKMRKELEKIEKRRAAGLADLPSDAEQKDITARESFQAGFDLLAEDDLAAAIPHLARAVHIDPSNAQYHAYYGQALTADPNSKHKAESELQTAIKMEPENIEFRIMLIEFFIEMDLLKRAEGELVRMLAIKPDHKEAMEMLRQIRELTQR